MRTIVAAICLAFVAAASAFAPSALPALRSPALRARSTCSIKMQEDGPSTKRVGASIDADGKSNVWAVEPKMSVQDPNSEGGAQKIAIYGAILAAGGAAIAAIVNSGILSNVEQ